ncbi:ubiquitin-like-specific protease ESD4 isoform X2 [Cucumis melo var. makuwa]|uniref:Ubiquitin-like-specific protease ESD4 isoform X2 n=1 Tax=Cucumis melo var. makuwa TaxID=1194695 RepID=A0A5A7VHY6_CUCMM|nr:ubiquitin-like-specific protease ESD4 isoform X2 [Cucumis melo var. makuwa]
MLDLKHVKMLDDKEKFRNYPWGRLCFSLTKQFIQNAVKSKRKFKNLETESKAYAFLQGFPMVLAYWAYEILPQLASGYVTRIGKGCPRILNWESVNNSIGKILKITSFWKKILDEEACAMKESNMAERISSLHEDIKDLKKQHKEDLNCLKKGQEEIVRLLLSLTEVVNQRLSHKCESEKQSQEPLEKNPPPPISLEMIDADVDKEKEVVQEKAKVKIMEIATNIEKARPKRQPKPSKKVLENVKEQKNVRGKKNDSPKPTRHSPRIKDLAPSFALQISQL